MEEKNNWRKIFMYTGILCVFGIIVSIISVYNYELGLFLFCSILLLYRVYYEVRFQQIKYSMRRHNKVLMWFIYIHVAVFFLFITIGDKNRF